MSDVLSRYLSSGPRHASLSPEKLEMMGKEAARMFLDRRVALSDAVTKIAGQVEEINAEQVQRVCEFANTAVHLDIHDGHKTAGAGHSYPQFDLADPSRVLQSLALTSGSEIVAGRSSDYQGAPARVKTASARLEDELQRMFGADREKTAADLPYTTESGVDELMSAKNSLTAIKNTLTGSIEQLDLMRKEAQDAYYRVVKEHLLEGNSLADVVRAARETGTGPEKIASILAPVIERLLEEKVDTANSLRNQVSDFSKVAHREVNPEHPFVQTFGALAHFDEEIEKIAAALQGVDEQIAVVKKAIQEFARAR